MEGVLNKKLLRGLGAGIVGGLIGTVLMDIVMIITFLLADQPADLFFKMVGEKLGHGWLAGLAIHNCIGMSGGIVFALLVLNIHGLEITTMKKGILLGLGAGAITIPLGCIPLAIWLGEPILEVIAFSLLPHLVWGTVLGWTVSYALVPAGTRSPSF